MGQFCVLAVLGLSLVLHLGKCQVLPELPPAPEGLAHGPAALAELLAPAPEGEMLMDGPEGLLAPAPREPLLAPGLEAMLPATLLAPAPEGEAGFDPVGYLVRTYFLNPQQAAVVATLWAGEGAEEVSTRLTDW